ncbi:MAG: hypothetical protein B1H07_04605 [Campylobacteraceae bacterium 4484_166]|nr:MAG: hypothetical protein B1H07_04605 [Campylobacteraceae bacterium 4484_166]
MSLLYPWVLALLPIYVLCIKFCKPTRQTIKFSNTKVLQQITKQKNITAEILKFLIVVCMVVALSSPVKKHTIMFDNTKGYEISLIFDISGSMLEADKFDISKKIVQEFITTRSNDAIALSIFADFAYIASPLTYDTKSIIKLLEYLEVGVAGKRKTALYEAIFLSSNLFKNSKSKNKIAIVLTDGYDTAKTVPLQVAIDKAKDLDIKVYCVGVGNERDYDASVLEYISKQTGAKFFQANSKKKLEDIYETIGKLEKSKIKSNKYIKYQYFYIYFMLVAFVFSLILMTIRR